MMALNAKIENTTLSVNPGSDDGSEHWNWECDSERQNWKAMVALNAKTREVALNAELKVWHDDFECHK